MQRMLNYLIEEVRLRCYLIAFLAVVLVCGWLYSLLTVYGHGVNASALSFLEGVFFSIVTVSSLGYGDIYPVGFSRVIAGAEVLFGLVLMGIMIAKVSSRRLSYHVQRLFASEAQQRLDSFTDRFARIQAVLARTARWLGDLYEQTPSPRPPSRDKAEVLTEFRRVIERLHTASIALREYFDLECRQHAYFKVAPDASVRRVGKSLEEVLYRLGQLIISLPAAARPEAIDGASRELMRRVLTNLDRVAEVVQDQCPDQESVTCFRDVRETCQKVRNSHFATRRSLPRPRIPLATRLQESRLNPMS